MNHPELRTLLLKRFNLPTERSIRSAMRSFTIAEKAVFYFLIALFSLSGLTLLWQASSAYLVEVPSRGGTLVEGVVGNPRFVNPVLAISEADKNLVALVYSGLMRLNQEGVIENDLAEDLSISDDRLTYIARLRTDARFHDGSPVTADDVIFTIGKIVDPLIKSPKMGSWDGVVVEKVDDRTISFTLKQAYNPFIYNLTLGILPREIWKNVSDDEFSFSQWNTLPIGSGPYKVERVERNSGGIPDFYRLTPFEDALNSPPFISKLVFRFYPSEAALFEAYEAGLVESLAGLSPEKISEVKKKGTTVISSPLPRVFAVFFNQSQSKALSYKEVREALELSSPKSEIIDEILGGYGTIIDGPLPAGLYSWTETSEEKEPLETRLEMAREKLAEAGWQVGEESGILEKTVSGASPVALSFSLATGDAPELRQVAEKLADSWRRLGAEVSVKTFETGELNQDVIRPRNFDALFFGEVVGRDADLYPFWHSSQKSDPGLNVSLYASSRADRFLEEARRASNPLEIEENYKAFAEELKADLPAVFLYTPRFLYVVPEKIKDIRIGSLAISQDRFLGIRNWYIEMEKVWEIFVD